MSDPVVLLSTGDVVGPAGGVTDNSMVLFSGTSGKLIKGNNAVVTAAGLAILDDVSAAAQKVTLGLGNVDNTSDINKPISTATQTALDLKATIDSPTFTGIPSAPTASPGTITTQLATTAFVAAAEKLNAPITTVAAAANIDLTTGAPNTSQLAISGTGVTITGFTVAAGRCYFVRFAGALTLTNSASLVTQTGADITTASGDTCIIRAISANVVEILCGNFLSHAATGTRGQTWQDVKYSRSVGVTYTNTTGRPIMVAIDNSGETVIVNGLQLVASGPYGVQFIVPAGSTYSVPAGGNGIDRWLELR